MPILESPEAQMLLSDATLEPQHLVSCRRQLQRFLDRYLPLFYRVEQSHNATIVIEGLLSDLARKTCEPIARREGVERKPIQFFVGAGKWDDEAVLAEYRRQVVAACGDPQGVLIVDPSAFPKKGHASCGVKRQWCGRLGKIENCQVGVFLAYATPRGCAFLDRQLYLPEDWAADPERRAKTPVPPATVFQTKIQMATAMLAAHGAAVPHAWVVAADEFGRSAEFRARLRESHERYLLDVPCDTLIRDLAVRRPPRQNSGAGRMRQTPWRRVDAWLQRQPPERWERITIRAGEKGPLTVDALSARVRARQDQRAGDEERLLVLRDGADPAIVRFALSNAAAEVPLADLARAACERHRIEELFQAGKGEAGLAQYELRSWVGWHHHMTLVFLALWFVTLERRRLGEKKTGDHRAADTPVVLSVAS